VLAPQHVAQHVGVEAGAVGVAATVEAAAIVGAGGAVVGAVEEVAIEIPLESDCSLTQHDPHHVGCTMHSSIRGGAGCNGTGQVR
jgi:hypothetical protein